MNYIFHPQARAEHLDLVAFYESRRAGLGRRYLDVFGLTMERVCRAPWQFPIEAAPDIKRCRVAGFPYNVLYRERGNVIEVLAVAGHRQRPRYWIARA